VQVCEDDDEDCVNNHCPIGCDCEFDCRPAADDRCGGTCDAGSTCRVQCDGVNNCDGFVCTSSAACRLICNGGTGNCEFETCSAGAISCGGDDVGCGAGACQL
jgi:hypothetical protein